MEELITIHSDFSVRETIDRLTSILRVKGLTVFFRLDHAANAAQAGLELRPTELILFGNPKAGTLLMQDRQTSGIDLPIKALAWEDEFGKVWLTCNNIILLAGKHNLAEKGAGILRSIEEGMKLVAYATATK